MTDETNAPENLTKLAEEAKLVAETTQDPNGRRALRLMSLKYKRLAEFARKQPDDGAGDKGSEGKAHRGRARWQAVRDTQAAERRLERVRQSPAVLADVPRQEDERQDHDHRQTHDDQHAPIRKRLVN